MAFAFARYQGGVMRSKIFALLAAAALAGCGGGGQATPDDVGDRVTFVVANEFANAITAYAVWGPTGRRVRLGEVQPDRERTFETPRAGDQIALGLELTSAPPGGTTGGPTGFQGGAPGRINPEMVTSEILLISAGEGIEWRLTPTGSLVYARLSPR
jgi:hypothetical protein